MYGYLPYKVYLGKLIYDTIKIAFILKMGPARGSPYAKMGSTGPVGV